MFTLPLKRLIRTWESSAICLTNTTPLTQVRVNETSHIYHCSLFIFSPNCCPLPPRFGAAKFKSPPPLPLFKDYIKNVKEEMNSEIVSYRFSEQVFVLFPFILLVKLFIDQSAPPPPHFIMLLRACLSQNIHLVTNVLSIPRWPPCVRECMLFRISTCIFPFLAITLRSFI